MRYFYYLQHFADVSEFFLPTETPTLYNNNNEEKSCIEVTRWLCLIINKEERLFLSANEQYKINEVFE